MTYIKYTKEQLVNLEFSLNRELIRTNRAGTYASTTLAGCNTRKYHGLLACPMPHIDQNNHILLSSLDVSVKQNDNVFNLGIRKYPYVYEPKGHKYLTGLDISTTPEIYYQVGDIKIKVERLLCEDDRILVKYSLLESSSDVQMIFKPFLAFRCVHDLSKANLYVNKKYTSVENGVKIKMYEAYKALFMQFNKKPEYVHVPDWYYNIEYERELCRGYDYKEDLYVPGYFELSLKKGQSVIFSAGLSPIAPGSITRKYNSELSKRIERETYLDCLKNAAQQFLVKRDGKTEVIAGYPWFGRWGRDTFISLPGLSLYLDNYKTCEDVLKTMAKEVRNGLFPNIGYGNKSALNSVDAPFWFIWAVQQCAKYKNNNAHAWDLFGKTIKAIFNKLKEGTDFNIKIHDNGLIFAGKNGKALTWMDAVVNGKPVTPRIGYNVEINALWYNAIMFALDCAKESNDNKFINDWKHLPETIKKSFNDVFWSDEKEYLADYVNEEFKDWAIRPNQVFACSMEYSPIDDNKIERILETVKSSLLTPKGLRTLNPDHKDYIGIYEGGQEERDNAYHQGTVWPWLLGHFCEAYLKIHGKSAVNFVNNIFEGFEEEMSRHGIGTVSEIFDGDPPHYPKGAISQAWSVAELIRIHYLLQKYK